MAPDEDGPGRQARPSQEAGASFAKDAAIVCRACTGPVTTRRQRREVLGAHEHRFMNPAGALFHIGCFGEAPGCAVLGPPSEAYTWFPGHAWRFAHCRSCGEHLGWHFGASGASSFFGLRLDRIRDYLSDSSPDA
jgi:hypothetical protein